MTATSHFEATMTTSLQPLMSSAKHDWRAFERWRALHPGIGKGFVSGGAL